MKSRNLLFNLLPPLTCHLLTGFMLCSLLVCYSVGSAQVVNKTCKRPNVVLIICDDMRYDSFEITGGPEFMHTPSIDRIANEGARFDNYYCTYSLCVASRASIMTGLYPHSHGAVDNCNVIQPGVTKLAEVMQDAGYQTAMIGKYHIEDTWQPGWDYWLATKGTLDYTNPSFYYFNTSKNINGNIEQIIADSVHHYLSNVDTPFFLNVGHLAPHRVCVPLPQYQGELGNRKMPIPPNYYPFTEWYPSFLYEDSSKLYLEKSKLKSDYEGYFEGILGIEDNTKDILDILTQRNLLENTMIIFMSDNGAIFGEHLLKGKGEAYEPSTHLPLFIRYPAWFSPNTVVNGDFFTLNIDIMPTILDAACINPFPYHLQGVSLTKLTSGEAKRPDFLYETIKLASGSCETVQEANKPSIRSVRSKTHKYISYQCDHITEELFDLVNDPLETKNLIMNPVYETLIEYFRQRLDELRLQYHDTLSTDTAFRSCYLATPPQAIAADANPEGAGFQASPNPAANDLKIYAAFLEEGIVSVTITNSLGQLLYQDAPCVNNGEFSKEIDVSAFPAGTYFVRIVYGNKTEVIPVVKI